MITRKTWKEFKDSGCLWFANMILHTFGWAICIDVDDNGDVKEVFPARVKFRGFSEEVNTKNYINISNYLKNNIDELLKEAKE